MRTYFIYYKKYNWRSGDYEYDTCTITLNKIEKANIETFDSKFNDHNIEVLSWSLIEE